MRIGTIHWVYPHGDAISCPHAIGRKVAERLRRRFAVAQYDWDDTRAIAPAPGDVLLGHPHPCPWTVFRRSARRPGWSRVLVMSPYHHGDCVQVAWLDPIVRRSDAYLALTGNFWFASLDRSPFSHWRPRMTHVDLAVDRGDFPALKRRFNPPGRRRFLYIGHSGWQKNPRYLREIARAMPEASFAWIGAGPAALPGFRALGAMDFRAPEARRAVADHDFLLTVGRADANPATVLEAMAWGLIPVCTRESGYAGHPGIPNVPLADAASAARVLRDLQDAPEERLLEMQALNWEALERRFTWDRVAAQVVAAIASEDRPPCAEPSPLRALRIRWASLVSPYAAWRPSNAWPFLKRAWGAAAARALRDPRWAGEGTPL